MLRAGSSLLEPPSRTKRRKAIEDRPCIVSCNRRSPLVMIAGALGNIAVMLRDCWDPRQIDYGEGIVLWQAQHILDPSMTYRNISTPPYNVTHYPPLYHLATRAVEIVNHNWMAAGRLVSVASGLGTALVIGALIFAVLPRRVSRADRWTAAIFGGCSIFLHPIHHVLDEDRQSGLSRTVYLPCCHGDLSLAAAVGHGKSSAVTIFVLAGFTKQALITIPLACLLLESFLNRRRMLAGLAWGAGLAAVPLIVMQYRTHGGFLLNLVYYNVNPMDFAGGRSNSLRSLPQSLDPCRACRTRDRGHRNAPVAPPRLRSCAGGAEGAKSPHCSARCC